MEMMQEIVTLDSKPSQNPAATQPVAPQTPGVHVTPLSLIHI